MSDKKINMFDPALGAYREMPRSWIIKNIKEAKKMEKDLIKKGVITEKEVAVD